MLDIKLETKGDLFELLRQLPEQERWAAMGVINRLQDGKIDVDKATEEIKQLFLRSGMAHE
ncbi:hypothetical protein DFR58_14711 [Anaerobacterium chartisolvens]|uniref:Uncharacterized protein n=1 Tax=Anaerobacterium chartisolvens TaxID=1297424 RepID=A0A369AFD1_9FIRM|nr:hypothetical protein [Anaerobacterium chartisolvens]RCX07891.1 hypothetical protein DFR58_14711 [Anaerobacterium chartisolvens]